LTSVVGITGAMARTCGSRAIVRTSCLSSDSTSTRTLLGIAPGNAASRAANVASNGPAMFWRLRSRKIVYVPIVLALQRSFACNYVH
jgi:hypothetical protein